MLCIMDTNENIFLSHVSALACWVAVGHKGLASHTQTALRYPATSLRNVTTAQKLGLLESKLISKLGNPLDVLVPTHAASFKSPSFTCHLCTNELPPGSFRRLTSNVFVTSPELTFVQMGTVLTDVQLALVGMMLCGTYAIAPNEQRSLIDRAPLTTMESLRAMASKDYALRGAQTARAALDLMVEGSRSPRESSLLLLLCSKDGYGSYGMPRPELNRVVDLSPAAASLLGTSQIKPDLCWYEQRTLMEYDSWNHHSRPDELADDDLRIQAFRKDQWEAVTLRTVNMDNPTRFDKIVRNVLAPSIGVAIPEVSRDFVLVREHLREECLAFDPYAPTKVARKNLVELREKRAALLEHGWGSVK